MKNIKLKLRNENINISTIKQKAQDSSCMDQEISVLKYKTDEL